MKKKNVLTLALSLCLVAVIAIGGTLALLTAKPDSVTNHFVFATGDGDGNVITVDVTEKEPDKTGNETITGTEQGGWTYTNVVPGQELNKTPSISAVAYQPSYVYVRITDGALVSVDKETIGAGWTVLPGVENVYYKEITADMIPTGDNKTVALGDLFTKVKVADGAAVVDGEGDPIALNDIKIEVSAVVKGSFTTAEAAYTAGGAANLFQSAGAGA